MNEWATNYRIYEEIRDELTSAEVKHPEWSTDPLHAFAVVQEEIGECQRAILQRCEAYKEKELTLFDVRKEAIQSAAMLFRFIAHLSSYDFEPLKGTHVL